MGLSRTVSEINGNFSRKSQNFPHPCRPILRPDDGVLFGFGYRRTESKKPRMVGLPDGQKNSVSYSRLDTTRTCDGQTPHDGKDRAMESVAPVKIASSLLPLYARHFSIRHLVLTAKYMFQHFR